MVRVQGSSFSPHLGMCTDMLIFSAPRVRMEHGWATWMSSVCLAVLTAGLPVARWLITVTIVVLFWQEVAVWLPHHWQLLLHEQLMCCQFIGGGC